MGSHHLIQVRTCNETLKKTSCKNSTFFCSSVMEIIEQDKMFSDCYADFSLFNPFDAFSQDNLLALESEQPTNITASSHQNTYNNNTKAATTHKVPKLTTDTLDDLENMDDTNQYGGIVSDDELASLNIKDLNRKLKQRRRTLKNRKYATDCREKKDSEVHTLEASKDNEVDCIGPLEKENDELRDKLSKLKSHYVKLFEFAKKNGIELKPRNVPMGSLEST